MTDFATRLNDFLFDQLTIGFAAFVALCLLVVWVMNQMKLDRKAPLPFTVERGLKWYAIALSPIWLSLLIGVLWAAFTILAQLVSFEVTSKNGESLRSLTLGMVGIFTAIGATIGAPLALARARATEKQTHTAEQGLITDRINKAVEGLGATKQVKRQRKNSKGDLLYEDNTKGKPDFKKPITEEVTEPNVEVRVGAIYSLERIAQESLSDHLQIIEILCAYIRENAPQTGLSPTEPPFSPARVRTDIQTALKVIGRRSDKQKSLEKTSRFRLDLRFSDLSGADFSKGDFSAAIFSQCRLEAANFSRSSLRGTVFVQSLLNGINWWHADLTGANLDLAIINLPKPLPGGMADSVNFAKTIKGISLCGADITAIDYLGEENITNDTFGTSDTKLHYDLDEKRSNLRQLQNQHQRALRSDGENAKETEAALKETGFMEWCPFERADMATGHMRRKQLTRLDLNKWPYDMSD